MLTHSPARSIAPCRGRIDRSLRRPASVAPGAVLVAVLTALLFTACARQSVRPAPFRVRPDSVEAGNLRGPFDGRIVDATTGKPVAGALVYATWTIQSGYGLAHPVAHREFVTSTDAAGVYRIPALSDLPGGGSKRLTDFHLIVYKRGYVAYRSDRRFADLGPRRDFAQHEHRIELDRWRSDLSHAHHLRYVGGGPAISALTAWETEAAAAELSYAGDQPGGAIGTDLVPRSRGTYLIAAQLLQEDEVKRITSFDGDFEGGPLGDEPDTESYSSQHLKAMGLPETYDVALRVWRLPPDQAAQRYDELRSSLPGVQEPNDIADRSLLALEGDIYGMGFLDARRGIVALLTCGRGQCASPEIASALGAAVHAKIQRAWPLPDAGPNAGPDGRPTGPGTPGPEAAPDGTSPGAGPEAGSDAGDAGEPDTTQGAAP